MKNIGDAREPLAFSEADNVYPKTYEELCVFLSDKGRAQAWSENLSSGPGPFSYPENFWGLGFVLAGE